MSSRRRSRLAKPLPDTLVVQCPFDLEKIENVISTIKDPKGATVNAIMRILKVEHADLSEDEFKALLKVVLLEGLDSGRLLRPPGSKVGRGLVGRFLVKATDSCDNSLEKADEKLVKAPELTSGSEIVCATQDNVANGAAKEINSTQEIERTSERESDSKKTQKKRRPRRRKSVAEIPDLVASVKDHGHHNAVSKPKREIPKEEKEEDKVQRPKQGTVPSTRGKRGRKPAKTAELIAEIVAIKEESKDQPERQKAQVESEEDGVQEEVRVKEDDGQDTATGDSVALKEDDPPDDLNNTFVLVETCSPAAYLQRVQEVRERLTERCEDAEKYLRWNVPSTVLERVRSAIGQSTLITTNEKSTMARFEAQCREAMTPGGDNPYRPTMNDLEAYWDLVELQVKNIDQLFDQVHLLVKREAVYS